MRRVSSSSCSFDSSPVNGSRGKMPPILFQWVGVTTRPFWKPAGGRTG